MLINKLNKKFLAIAVIVIVFSVSNMNFTAKAQIWHNVTISSHAGGTIQVVGGGYNTAVPSIFHFQDGTIVTFTALPSEGNHFVRFSAIAGENIQNTTQNPITFAIYYSFELQAIFEPNEASEYSLTVGSAGVGSGLVTWGTAGDQTNGYGNFMVSASDNLIFTAVPYPNSTFNYWNFYDDYSHTYCYVQNPFYGYLSRNMSVNAVFSTDSVTIEPIAPNEGTTELSWKLNQGTNYQIYGSIVSAGTIPTEGSWFMFAMPLVSNPSELGVPITEVGNNYVLLESGVYSNGYFNFATAVSNYSYTVYNKIQVGVFHNTTAQQYLDMVQDIMSFINPPITQGLWDDESNQQWLDINNTRFFFSPEYTVEWASITFATPSPTPDPNNLYGISYNTIGFIALFLFCSFGLTFLTRRYSPLAGLITGMVISIIIASLLSLIPLYSIFLCVLLVCALIIVLIKGK